MPASKSSAASRRSKGGAALPASGTQSAALCLLLACATMACAIWYFFRQGVTLFSGDAEAHLNIARRIIDSLTPGWSQVGTTWLPLPHLLMLPFVRIDELWRTGLAGAIPSGLCTALAATFLFSAMRRIFTSVAAAAAAAAVYLLNPNTLYLGSVPMTEPALFLAIFALLYFTVLFADTGSLWAATGAGVAALAGTLVRYEAWFLLPFAAFFFLFKGGPRRWPAAILFSLIAAIGPLLWFAHNWWYFGDPLYFYRGPWSALAIQGKAHYPGRGNWKEAAQYFWAAGTLVVKWPGLLLGAIGALWALATTQARWPVIFVILTPAFYVWSLHSSGTPIFVPHLFPHGYYNIRYAMALLPVAAIGAAALGRYGRWPALAAVALATLPFLIDFQSPPITLKEAEVNSTGRRAWAAEAVQYLRQAAHPGDTYLTSFNDMTAIYRTLGIPLKRTLTGDNFIPFVVTEARPDLLLRADWAVVMGGDQIQGFIDRIRLNGPVYELDRRIFVKGQPVIEIYHRHDPLPKNYENSLR